MKTLWNWQSVLNFFAYKWQLKGTYKRLYLRPNKWQPGLTDYKGVGVMGSESSDLLISLECVKVVVCSPLLPYASVQDRLAALSYFNNSVWLFFKNKKLIKIVKINRKSYFMIFVLKYYKFILKLFYKYIYFYSYNQTCSVFSITIPYKY